MESDVPRSTVRPELTVLSVTLGAVTLLPPGIMRLSVVSVRFPLSLSGAFTLIVPVPPPVVVRVVGAEKPIEALTVIDGVVPLPIENAAAERFMISAPSKPRTGEERAPSGPPTSIVVGEVRGCKEIVPEDAMTPEPKVIESADRLMPPKLLVNAAVVLMAPAVML